MFVLFFQKNTRSSADLEHKKIACLKLAIKTFYKKANNFTFALYWSIDGDWVKFFSVYNKGRSSDLINAWSFPRYFFFLNLFFISSV